MTKEEYKKELLSLYKEKFGTDEGIVVDSQYFRDNYGHTIAVVFSSVSGEAVDEAYTFNEIGELLKYCEDNYYNDFTMMEEV